MFEIEREEKTNFLSFWDVKWISQNPEREKFIFFFSFKI